MTEDRPLRSDDGSKAQTAAGPYSIGSDLWPGLSKLIEECGEVTQVAGKIIATHGESAHWDGTDLRSRLTDELADLSAALIFVFDHNDLDHEQFQHREDAKTTLFEQWHVEQGGVAL